MKFEEGKILSEFTVKANGKDRDVKFRFPRMSDAAAAMEHINSLVEEKTYLSIVKKVNLEEEKKWLEGTIKACRDGDTIFVVVESDGKYKGSAGLERGATSASHVGRIGLALCPECRGLGIGRRLMEFLEAYSKEEFGLELLRLEYYAGNEPAQRLYEKLGYETAGTIPKMSKRDDGYFDAVFYV